MKLGIKAMRYFPAAGCMNFGYLPAGSTVDLATVLDGSPQQLPFTPETADLAEEWTYDTGGRSSLAQFSAEIRANREQYRDVLQLLTGRRFLFEVETIDGKRYIIGSPGYPPTFTWSDRVSGISKSAFSINISCRSLHGVLFGA